MSSPDKQYYPFFTSQEEMKEILFTIRRELKEYLQKYHLSSCVLGISGGIDSALCAALLRPICEELKIPLVGRSITIETNGQDEIERSLAVGSAFCHDFQHIDLTDTFLVNKQQLISFDASMLSKMRQGNMKARMRMIILYDLAQLYRGIVISTDNYTEYLTGFWTLHGDVGDYAPIMNLWKTEVYRLSEYLLEECNQAQKEALQSCIDATPVDGLGISKSDCEQLGVNNYFEADRIFASYFFEQVEGLDNHPLIKRYKASEYKRNNPVAILRSLLKN